VAALKERTHIKQSWPSWRWIVTGLNIMALVLSIILSWHYFAGGSMIGCGGGSPCDKVLNSQWSVIAGLMPISGLAVGVYLALLVATLFIGPATEAPIRQLAWSAMLILAGAISGSAIWFTILQKWFIGDFCPYCMTTHITGLTLSVIIIWRGFREVVKPLAATGRVLIGLVLAGSLALLQVGFTPSAVYYDGESKENLPSVDYRAVPLVGSPDAPYVVTLLFDYQCSHCQKIHFMLDEAINRYAGKLSFVLCPAPLNTQCNPYVPRDVDAFKNSCELTKISLAVWLAKREAFPAFENWMFTFESGDGWRPRSLETARAKAIEFVGQKKLDSALKEPWIEQYIQYSVQIFGQTIQNGQGGVPKLIYGSRWVVPELNNAEELVMILQNSLALPKP